MKWLTLINLLIDWLTDWSIALESVHLYKQNNSYFLWYLSCHFNCCRRNLAITALVPKQKLNNIIIYYAEVDDADRTISNNTLYLRSLCSDVLTESTWLSNAIWPCSEISNTMHMHLFFSDDTLLLFNPRMVCSCMWWFACKTK